MAPVFAVSSELPTATKFQPSAAGSQAAAPDNVVIWQTASRGSHRAPPQAQLARLIVSARGGLAGQSDGGADGQDSATLRTWREKNFGPCRYATTTTTSASMVPESLHRRIRLVDAFSPVPTMHPGIIFRWTTFSPSSMSSVVVVFVGPLLPNRRFSSRPSPG